MKRQPERDLQKAVVALLRATVPEQFWNCPNVEVRGGANAARAGGIAKRMGSNTGWADIQIVNPRSMVLTQIELKSKRGVLSEAQKSMQAAWRERYIVCRTLDEAVFAIKLAGWDTSRSAKAQKIIDEASHEAV
jgi:hypothetical protein